VSGGRRAVVVCRGWWGGRRGRAVPGHAALEWEIGGGAALHGPRSAGGGGSGNGWVAPAVKAPGTARPRRPGTGGPPATEGRGGRRAGGRSGIGPAGSRGWSRVVLSAAFFALPVLAEPFASGRGDVLVRRDCRSSIGREEVTLFGNGTVRVRSGPLGAERMVLGEVRRDEVESLVAAIRREDLREAGAGAAGPEGDWVERCLLELPVLAEGGGASGSARGEPVIAGSGEPAVVGVGESATDAAEGAAGGAAEGAGGLPDGDAEAGPGRPAGDGPATRFVYGQLDSLSLPLSRLVALVDGLAARVMVGAAAGGLPTGYRPREGDVLRRIDGVLFRVVRSTAALEGMPRGWELQGVQQPLAVYVVESDLPREFVELVSRERPDDP
jgi:hypothetical protein